MSAASTRPARRLLVAVVALVALVPAAVVADDDPPDEFAPPTEDEATSSGAQGSGKPGPGRACEHADARATFRLDCAPTAGGGAARADYNGDGHTDLAVGVPHRGMVHVIYGSATGLTSTGNQLIHRTDVPGFGGAVAGGDFNCDGYADLAVGVPLYSSGRGQVAVYYGGPQGLTPFGQQTFALSRQTNSWFANSLVWGRFDDDGCADLAIGAPGVTVDSRVAAGVVHVLYGSPQGLTTTGRQLWHEGNIGPGSAPPESGAWFGFRLAAGDLGFSGHHDLAMSAPNRTVGGRANAGEVRVLYGSRDGLQTVGSQRTPRSTSTRGSLYGHALAVGDVDGDGVGDLAVGAPGEAGYVLVSRGTRGAGLTSSGQSILFSDRIHISPSGQVYGDRFGWSVAAADFSGDGVADLAVGEPHRAVADADKAGGVHLFHGRRGEPMPDRADRILVQGGGVSGVPTQDGELGTALTAWNWGRTVHADLAIGAPGAWVSGVPGAGAIHVLYGSSTGLSTSGQQRIHQGHLGTTVERASFGWAMY